MFLGILFFNADITQSQTTYQDEVRSSSEASSTFAKGGGEINPNGTFTYQIPIEVPSGRQGIQPNLSLRYRSDKGNGLLGIGWILTGLPAIARMNSGAGIEFQGNDTYVFMPNGWDQGFQDPRQRLVKTSFHTFHTLRDDRSRYKSSLTWDRSCGDGPCYWVVEDGNGNSYFFGGDHFHPRTSAAIWGNAPDRANGRFGIQTWLLYKVKDWHGNYYQVDYSEGKPLTIFYTMHDLEDPWCNERNISNCKKIQFEWEDRPDSTPLPQGFTNRLSNILITSRGQKVRSYHIDYVFSDVSGRSILKSVQEFGSHSPLSLPPYEFEYQTSNTKRYLSNLDQTGDYEQINTTKHLAIWDSLIGDVNGDGKDDLVRVYRGHTGQKINTLFGSENGFSWPPVVYSDFPFEDPNYQDPHRHNFLGDMNGDGFDDLVLTSVEKPNFRLQWALGSSDGFTSSLNHTDIALPSFADCDFWVSHPVLPGVSHRIDLSWGFTQFKIGDINGDQRLDIVLVDPVCRMLMYVRGQGNGRFSRPEIVHGPQNPWSALARGGAELIDGVFVSDLNGDGADDLVIGYSNPLQKGGDNGRLRIEFSLGGTPNTGGSNFGLGPIDWYDYSTEYSHQINHFLPGDINGDSRDDVIHVFSGYAGRFGTSGFSSLVGRDINAQLWFTKNGTQLVSRGPWATNQSFPYGLRWGYYDGAWDGSIVNPQHAHLATWQYHLADTNGDGIDDFIQIYRGEMGQFIYLALGEQSGNLSFLPLVEVTVNPTFDGDYFLWKWQSAVGDFNGDNLADLILVYYGIEGLFIDFAIGTPHGLGPVERHRLSSGHFSANGITIARDERFLSPNLGGQTRILIGDINGDGKDDPIIVNNAAGVDPEERRNWYVLSDPSKPDLLDSNR